MSLTLVIDIRKGDGSSFFKDHEPISDPPYSHEIL